ncbi:helix-turn-helix domain-containing protein [Rummeliibacillus suwonensis]|mgnify:CR=1 FL=1|uniref:helix-turn-helix domain-containing protein n=1 Tax=Rummeliibacillus suwonensis TaxID=1306154 RepID=UPI0011B3BDF4|nr:helix-turn-helix transcriptional regulator [Rummeliibacillus suwonensis]
MDTLGTRLTYLREKRGWTKTYVANKLGIKTVSTYANWEYGTRQPDNEMLVKIADLYDVSLDFLLGRSDAMNPKEFENAGITNEEYTSLTPYQREVVDFFLVREDLFFHDNPEKLMDALEQFEIFYEVWKKQQDKK